MSVPIATSFEIQFPQVPPRKHWTREHCAELEAAGVFKSQRLELVAGDLISKMGKNRPHVNAFRVVLVWLQKTFGDQFVDAEAPIDVNPEDNPANEPEPDIIVLHRECAGFVSANPQPRDIRLVVEISDTTLNFDLSVKAALYARAGIAEYWFVDVAGRQLFCHRDPALGQYNSVRIYNRLESVAPLGVRDSAFSTAQLG